ncbi:hypothetical protein B0H34DRAFT_671507 [Crassisporium funariophilum]|nr:hypothetical protein B0H34DRAFT_671507 [Crassisporium funariophilum]
MGHFRSSSTQGKSQGVTATKLLERSRQGLCRGNHFFGSNDSSLRLQSTVQDQNDWSAERFDEPLLQPFRTMIYVVNIDAKGAIVSTQPAYGSLMLRTYRAQLETAKTARTIIKHGCGDHLVRLNAPDNTRSPRVQRMSDTPRSRTGRWVDRRFKERSPSECQGCCYGKQEVASGSRRGRQQKRLSNSINAMVEKFDSLSMNDKANSRSRSTSGVEVVPLSPLTSAKEGKTGGPG